MIGGGVIGLSIARELARAGRSVTLIERGTCAGESSWAAAGMLSPQVEADTLDTFTRMGIESRSMFPGLAEELRDETGLDIGLDRTGTIYAVFTEAEAERLSQRYVRQREAGIEVMALSAVDVRRAEPFVSPDVVAGLFFPGDWQVQNRMMCAALRRSAEMAGAVIREGVTAERLNIENGRVTGAQTKEGRFDAGWTVIAAGAWTSLLQIGAAEMPVRIEPVRGQIVAFHTAKPVFRHVIYSTRGYIVPRSDGEVLVGSTTERTGFDRSVTGEAKRVLTDVALEISPSMADLVPSAHWAGLRPASSDGAPVIGELEGLEGAFFAAGHYRNGILLAPLTARLAAEYICEGRTSEYVEEFSPTRFALRSVSQASNVL